MHKNQRSSVNAGLYGTAVTLINAMGKLLHAHSHCSGQQQPSTPKPWSL